MRKLLIFRPHGTKAREVPETLISRDWQLQQVLAHTTNQGRPVSEPSVFRCIAGRGVVLYCDLVYGLASGEYRTEVLETGVTNINLGRALPVIHHRKLLLGLGASSKKFICLRGRA